jgi:serine/threonine protein kinase
MNAPQTAHPTDQSLRAYGLGQVDAASAESVRRHIESCPRCARRAAEVSSGSLRDADVPRDPSTSRMSGGSASDRPGEARSAREMSVAGWSQLGSIGSEGGPIPGALTPPSAETLPPGLADHADYEVVGELGRGGMGVVYLARNKLMGRFEVLKVVSQDLIGRQGVRDRFLREIRNAAQLHHSNIVTAHSALRFGETIALAMEYVEGYDLAHLVKTQGPLPVPIACNFIHQAALGLQFAHEKGMVHRDIKPSNLIVARHGNRPMVKVLDFGLAKATRERSMDGNLTQEGQALGTPDYIAPEQILNAPNVDTRADIYSLGATLYFLLIGRAPFRASSLYEVYQSHISREAAPLDAIRPEVPADLAKLVARMMAKDPDRRLQEPKEVAQALKPFFQKGKATTGRTTEFSSAGPPPARVPPDGPIVPMPDRPQIYEMAGTLAPDPQVETLRPRPIEPTPEAPPRRERRVKRRREPDHELWRRWIGRGMVAGMVLLALGLLWETAVVGNKTNTPVSFLLLEGLPDDAVVTIDGRPATVIRPGGGRAAEISVQPGVRELEVTKDGFRPLGRKVMLRSGVRFAMRAELIPMIAQEKPAPIVQAPAQIAGDGRVQNPFDAGRGNPMQLTPGRFNGPLGRPTGTAVQELLPAGDSRRGGATWTYTMMDPGKAWIDVNYNDSAWRRGASPFGPFDQNLIRPRTAWGTPKIWLRTRFDVPEIAPDDTLVLHVFHDEDLRVFVNGRLLYEADGFTTRYRDIRLEPEKMALFQSGAMNIMAVSCLDTWGSRGVDVGLTLSRGGQ